MQIPILSGIYTDDNADFRTSYPRNLVPVPKDQGISKGYLRPAEGLLSEGTGPGVGRGGINWNDVCYRVMGSKLVSVSPSGVVTTHGDVGSGAQVSMDYSFDRLAIASAGSLFYWDGGSITKVTDVDLGTVVDMLWVDGYFMTTDSEFLIVTELADPTAVSQLKYGSSEVDPDPIKALLKLRNEVHALNRYTIEAYDNIGGTGFPFGRIEGAQIQRGTLGTHCCCVLLESIAFLGSGRKEAPAIWLGGNGSSAKISTREIDQILKGYTEVVLAASVMESKVDENHQILQLHLPDQTLVYDAAASKILGESVWHTLTTGVRVDILGQYKARNLVWCYDKWLVEDPTSTTIGRLVSNVSSHWGVVNGWEFGTTIAYNEGNGAIFHELELVALTGRSVLGFDPTIYTDYSLDGEQWSVPKGVKAGKSGQRQKRLLWLQQGSMRNWRIQRFNGTSDAHASFARLEAQVEGLAF